MQGWKWALGTGAVLAALPAAILVPAAISPAADHLDPPLRTDALMGDPTPDIPADIADVFAWYTNAENNADGTVRKAAKFNIGLTFAGPASSTLPAFYDRDVLYTLYISNDGDPTDYEFQIKFRFGEDTSKPGDQFGVKVTGVPGVDGDIIGPVETDLAKDGVNVRAGLFDDPFYFDVLGFRESRAMNTLRFDNGRDFFVRQNDTAIIIEIPRERVFNGTNRIDVWSSSARFGGNL